MNRKVYWYEAVIFLCTYALYIGYMFVRRAGVWGFSHTAAYWLIDALTP